MDKHYLSSQFDAQRIHGIMVNRNGSRSLLLATGSLLLLVLFVSTWETNPGAWSPILTICLIGLLVVVGPLAIGMIYVALLPGPFLIVSEKGITIRSPLIGTGTIAWSEIALLSGYRLVRGDIFSIQLRMPAVFLARRTRLQRWWLQYAHVRSRGHDTLDSVDISSLYLSLPVHDLLMQIEQRYGHELQHEQIHVRDYTVQSQSPQ